MNMNSVKSSEMKTQITPSEFVEKYKLIPKQLRGQFLEFLRQMPYLYDDEMDLDIFNDLITILVWFEKDLDCNNYYTLLRDTLFDDVYAIECQVYHDVITCLLRYLKWKVPLITSRDVIEFQKRQVLKQIKSEVAYRPGNSGYEQAKMHYESLFV